MAPRRFDVPLYYQPMTGEDPKTWINNVMSRMQRIHLRPPGSRTMHYEMRKAFFQTIAVTEDNDEASKDECETSERDIWFPDPLKIARCLISKPTIREMGEDEEKVYCGMIYTRNINQSTADTQISRNREICSDGPEYSPYEHKAKKRIGKTIKKLLIKHLPIMQDIIEKRKKENREKIRKDFTVWLERGKKAILKEKGEELKQMEKNAWNIIQLEREKTILELKGVMEEEIKEVNEAKKDYLKGAFKFQLDWILKDKEELNQDKLNLYSAVWNKILQNLSQKAKKKISELKCNTNQTIDKEAVEAIVEKEDFDNDLTVAIFRDKVEKVVNQLKSKVLTEELHIQEEKKRGEKIKSTVEAWNSLLEHVIMLFEKFVVQGFQGTPGECNYFLDRCIIEKLDKSLKEDDEMGSVSSKSAEKINETEISEEVSPVLSREASVFTVDMTVNPPDKELIIELNLFQVKKLIEEIKCEVLTKPLQVTAFMKDKSVELKSFSEQSDQESSYILNKLSDAYSILEKMLYKSDNKEHVEKQRISAVTEEVPYTIETDPEVKNRVDYLIKCYRSNPDNMRVLTNV